MKSKVNLSNVWKGMSTGILAQGWEEREIGVQSLGASKIGLWNV